MGLPDVSSARQRTANRQPLKRPAAMKTIDASEAPASLCPLAVCRSRRTRRHSGEEIARLGCLTATWPPQPRELQGINPVAQRLIALRGYGIPGRTIETPIDSPRLYTPNASTERDPDDQGGHRRA